MDALFIRYYNVSFLFFYFVSISLDLYFLISLLCCFFLCFFFFKQKTAYEMRISDWSSDVCSSDLLVLVTARLPNEQLTLDLKARAAEWADAGIATVQAIGDCNAPATIAAAVFAGHRYAREFGEVIDPDVVPFRRERIAVG